MIDYIIKAIATKLENGERVYVGLNSIPALIAAFMARDLYGKRIRILGVAEADNPSRVVVSPSTGSPFFVEEAPVMITVDSFDLAQKGLLDVMFLGPVQIDEETNVNLSVIGDYNSPKVRLPGGAATAFIMPLVKKVVLWNLKHSRRSLVKKVDFATGSAKYSNNKVVVVTNLGVLEYDRKGKVWKVTDLYPYSTVEDVVNNTEFKVIVPEKPKTIELTEDDKKFIEQMDPYNLRLALE
ncbi:MAG: Acyl CoA:acetate/3-ketoacid CoA transferase, beta subunit [Candidatus Aramenus sulfurataquae]|jgi:glutaconate CoA-transferase subunit B|uniref:Acyl CoA:acetate/3-ketoacid CoA transferase, beta subunit n=2 Tax=Candidatus Aramenus sulfurataquae TaxID=1326980 RepID=W7KVZ7_9CREN|nr:MAG: Acyl CoA:acetate/3-ketoacid CoA transferase, beta subunit [Candidatus Aramenus sulfurataquae]MCL7344437.1 CoA-transferase subunit beta [Candidatus Aramenus sulfurataquae]